MVSRREKRLQRKAAKQQKFEEAKKKLLEQVQLDDKPRFLDEPKVDKIPHLAPHLQRAEVEKAKEPRAVKSGSRFGEQVTWCISRSDKDGTWSWGEPRAWGQHEWDNEISPKFLEFEKLTWAEIDQFSSESGHKMHHGHEFEELVDEAQLRWIDLDLEEFADNIFRFRLEGTKRAWGFILQAHFHFVWWERDHRIYPVSN
ncbi:hypothetical protein [Microbulbifer celer]|uniref:Uncharacterized protein n=1 Tax=Microbulbifer celer TaxID=435905 RepID=A0ABW3UCS1_9GAMM|nr:hypothetical protein [Microbulbifer celer]UFN57372.1 hypothetical protein LPW13_17670 [Microbulbifer celer]